MGIISDSASSSNNSINEQILSEPYKGGSKINPSYGTIKELEDISSQLVPIDPIVQERLLRKLDVRMTIWGFFASFSCYLNRNNMQNAFTMGMDKELNLDSNVYNWSVTMFFIGYTILQIPGNILITKSLPRCVIPSFAIIWSSIVCFMPAVKSYNTLWLLRFMLGLAQAPFYPGMALLLGSWYTKNELGKRNMAIASGIPIAGAVGGFVAAGITKVMDGAGGLLSWQWLFIIEGLIGVLVGVSGYYLLPNYPHNTPWLTSEERQVAMARVHNHGIHVISNKYNWQTITNVLISPYPWLLIVLWTCSTICLGIVDNLVIILRDLGYSVTFANLMLTPLHICGAIVTVFLGWSSDKRKDRAFHTAGILLWVGVWYSALVMINSDEQNNSGRLVIAAACAISGNASTLSLCLVWVSEIYKKDHNSRAIAMAFINTMGMVIPNILNVKFWVVTDSPNFVTGKLAGMSSSILGITITIIIWFLLRVNSSGFQIYKY
ncbi:major facilitator superfamily domain-containing protein [Circinella umbellata]|nr:major facilitator superfamily domain-containing protein [Circinella umbellata]